MIKGDFNCGDSLKDRIVRPTETAIFLA